MDGKQLLDKKNSQITFLKSCRSCHGDNGTRISNIQWKALSDSSLHEVPYNDTLFYRFLDKDLKSDGSRAKTGVHWLMSQQQKADLLQYLKQLNTRT